MGRFHRQPSTDARAYSRMLEQGYRKISPRVITSLEFTFHPITGEGSKSRRWQGVTGGCAMRWGKGRPRLGRDRPAAGLAPRSRMRQLPETRLGQWCVANTMAAGGTFPGQPETVSPVPVRGLFARTSL